MSIFLKEQVVEQIINIFIIYPTKNVDKNDVFMVILI